MTVNLLNTSLLWSLSMGNLLVIKDMSARIYLKDYSLTAYNL